MTETTIPTFEDALAWAFTNGAIMRFYEDADKARTRPSVRITVVSALKPEEVRYIAVKYLDTAAGQTIQEAFAIAAMEVKDKFEAGEAKIVDEQAVRPKLRLA